MKTEFTLNEKLEIAFHESRYALCRELIKQGADKSIIKKEYTKIKPFNRTMSQDRIYDELS